MSWAHQIELEVRDYELDLQGIVNNSVYLNYLEHGRHKMIQTKGLDFHALHVEGWDPVVVRAELDYKMSLKSGDLFTIRSRVELLGKLRFIFFQEIIRSRDEVLCVSAKITATTLKNGKPSPPPPYYLLLTSAALVCLSFTTAIAIFYI